MLSYSTILIFPGLLSCGPPRHRCLQDNKYQKDFGKECKEEVCAGCSTGSSTHSMLLHYETMSCVWVPVDHVLKCIVRTCVRLKMHTCVCHIHYYICTSQVREYEMEASQDYRLNYRLTKACKSDIDLLCQTTCKVDEGQVGHMLPG